MTNLTRSSPSGRAATTGNDYAATHVKGGTPRTRKTLQLAELLGDAQGIDIDHNGHVYRLQITKAGKLILTK